MWPENIPLAGQLSNKVHENYVVIPKWLVISTTWILSEESQNAFQIWCHVELFTSWVWFTFPITQQKPVLIYIPHSVKPFNPYWSFRWRDQISDGTSWQTSIPNICIAALAKKKSLNLKARWSNMYTFTEMIYEYCTSHWKGSVALMLSLSLVMVT